jgi:hypothetical protein
MRSQTRKEGELETGGNNGEEENPRSPDDGSRDPVSENLCLKRMNSVNTSNVQNNIQD